MEVHEIIIISFAGFCAALIAGVALWARHVRRVREEEKLRHKIQIDEEHRRLQERSDVLEQMEGVLEKKERLIDLLKSRSL